MRLYNRRLGGAALSIAACSAIAGCSLPNVPGGIASVPAYRARSASNDLPRYIKHVVVVIQENRSFDNIFSGYPGANAPAFGYRHDGSKVAFHEVTFYDDPICGGYSLPDGYADWDGGKMDGFDRFVTCGGGISGDAAFAHLKRSLVLPYWTMASQYVLADRMFPTEWGQSFTAHLTLVAGTPLLDAHAVVAGIPSQGPWGCDAPPGTVTDVWTATKAYRVGKGPFPCFDESNSAFGLHTMAQTLDAANVSWKYYAPMVQSGWSSFDAIHSVRFGPDWANVVSPQTDILRDVTDGKLPSVAWVVPDLADSDHAGVRSNTGPSWVASVVNTIGLSKYWKSTAIVVLWDDWGAWYDNVPPPQVDFSGLAIRVPCLIVSPYVPKGYVAHQQFEFGSVLKLIEDANGLPPLGASDARAASLAKVFDFDKPARAFQPIAAPYPAAHFLHERPSLLPPDDM